MILLINILFVLAPILALVLIFMLGGAMVRKYRSKSTAFADGAEEKRWLAYRAIALPVLFILPFFLNHFQQIDCVQNGFPGPCYQINSGYLGGWLGVFAIIFCLSMVFSLRATWKRGKTRAAFARKQLRYAVISVAVTVVAYAILGYFSQGRQLHLLDGTAPPSQATLDYVKGRPFGVSLPPGFLIIISGLYLLGPYVQWRRITKDAGRVAGVKKKELFQ